MPPKGPDPSEFEPEFVVGDDSDISRIGTPLPHADGKEAVIAEEKPNGTEAGDLTEKAAEPAADSAPAMESNDTPPEEVPQDVRQKLRKLERLEPKYSGTT